MSTTMLQVATCIVLLTGVLGLPFATEEEANQFLGLKRQTPSLKYWYPAISKDAWDLGIFEKVKESLDTVKKSAQYYWNFGSYADEANKDRDHLKSYMDMFRQSGEHLQHQRRKRYIDITQPEPIIDPYCPDSP